MKRHLTILLTAAGLATSASPVAAQYPYPYPNATNAGGSRPGSPLSPYLNLRNGPNSLPGVNYYNFVRPNLQLQQQQQMYGGGQMIVPDQYSLNDPNFDPTAALPQAAGLPTNRRYQAFNNYGGYFNSMGTIGPAFGGPAGRSQPRR